MKTKIFVSLLSLALLTGGCDVVKQINELQSFARCEFRLKTLENTTLAGVSIQSKSYNQIGITDIARLTAALASGSLPLNFTLNVEVRNPNNTNAAMNKLDWLLFIDDIQMVQGTTTQRVNIAPGGGISTLPLQIGVDLKKALTGKTGEAILNFGFNLAGVGNRPTRVMLKAKPTIMVGNQAIAYPGYINIKNEFTSN